MLLATGDVVGFSVKDARTRMVLHRCDSPDELYPGDRKRRAVTDGDAVGGVDRMGGVEVTGVRRM